MLHKIRAHAIDGKLITWLENWLANRRQQVVINGHCSGWEQVLSGVPQGSILGPLCFIIFINDIDCAAELVNIISKFADDTKLGAKISSPADRENLQLCLNNLCLWAQQWGMQFNTDKCKVIHVGRNNPCYNYSMNNHELASVVQERDIGVVTHQSLKPSVQCHKAAEKANLVLGQICRAFHFRDRKVFIELYKRYVRCHLEFSVPAWRPWQTQDIETLEKVQKRAVKMVSGLRTTTYEERLIELNLPSLSARRELFDMLETFKILNGFSKVDSEKLFTPLHNTSQRLTRLSADPQNIYPKQAKGDVRKNFFTVRVIPAWNNLPKIVKESANPTIFKKRYDSYIRNLMVAGQYQPELEQN